MGRKGQPERLCPKCGVRYRATCNSYCNPCAAKKAKEFRKTPQSIEYRKKFNKLPKIKAYGNEYRKTEEFKEAVRKYRQSERGKEVIKNYNLRRHLKKKYNLSLQDRNLLLIAQGYLCASCGDRLRVENQRQIHIDHCHKTNAVRGILCGDCNISLGRMKENPERIRKLADYAERIKIEYPTQKPQQPSGDD